MIDCRSPIGVSQRNAVELWIGTEQLSSRNSRLSQNADVDQSVKRIRDLLGERGSEAESAIGKLIDLNVDGKIETVAACVSHVRRERLRDLPLYVEVPLLRIPGMKATVIRCNPLPDQRIQTLPITGRDQTLGKRIAQRGEGSHAIIKRTDKSRTDIRSRIVTGCSRDFDTARQ